jgi:hypothetical protein
LRIGRATPVFIALYAPLTLLAANAQEVPASVGMRSLLASLAVGLVIALSASLVFRREETAVVVGAFGAIVFFSYGRVYEGLKMLGQVGIELARHRYLVPAFAVPLTGLTIILMRRPGFAIPMARWLTTTALILVLFPSISLGRSLIQTRMGSWEPPLSVPSGLRASPTDPPDVVYVILDGYGRGDLLEASYGYDNTPFLDFLRRRGFYIAEQARSNYSLTRMSLASSLNMDYLESVLGTTRLDSAASEPLAKALRSSRVAAAFDDLGYETVAFETGYSPTELHGADVYLSPRSDSGILKRSLLAQAGLTPFEGVFLQTTLARVLTDFHLRGLRQHLAGLVEFEYDRHRARVSFTVENLTEAIAPPGPQFVFAHIVSPHPPFVFGRNGERLDHEEAFSFDVTCCDDDDHRQLYVDQLHYLNSLLMDEIDELLQASGGDVLLVLQGDHGPSAFLDWEEPETAAIRDRMGILNAYYLPGAAIERLYPSISPVNTFRVILDAYFGASLSLLDDVSYFTTTSNLSDKIRVEP